MANSVMVCLKEVLFNDKNRKMGNFEIKNGICIIPEGVKTIGYKAFMDCLELKIVVFPDSLERIEHFAFFGCTNLTEVVLPDTVEDLRFRDQRGVFESIQGKPFNSLIKNLVEEGYSVRLKEDPLHHWD